MEIPATSIRRSSCSPRAGEVAARRHRAAGVPLSHRQGRRIAAAARPGVRIVKGAYLEPPDIAYPKKADVDENFYRLCVRLMSPEAQPAGALLHIATHDVALADRLEATSEAPTSRSRAYEFAMLYGIRRRSSSGWPLRGKPLRVLISYGEYWFPWYMRRLAERRMRMKFGSVKPVTGLPHCGWFSTFCDSARSSRR